MSGFYAGIMSRFNYAQLQKRKVREYKDVLKERRGNPDGKFIELDHTTLKAIKERIRKEAKKEFKKLVILYVYAGIATAIFIWILSAIIS